MLRKHKTKRLESTKVEKILMLNRICTKKNNHNRNRHHFLFISPTAKVYTVLNSVQWTSQINNKKIGKVNCLHNRIEPFAVHFWALSIVLVHILQQVTQPTGLSSLNCGTGTVLYGRSQLGSILWKKHRPPPFYALAIVTLCCTYIRYSTTRYVQFDIIFCFN